jgi:hypothetical protein
MAISSSSLEESEVPEPEREAIEEGVVGELSVTDILVSSSSVESESVSESESESKSDKSLSSSFWNCNLASARAALLTASPQPYTILT